MNHFEIVGWDLSTHVAACERALAVTDALAGNGGEFAFEAHFRELESAWELAEAIPNGRFSHYFWRPMHQIGELRFPDLSKVINARLTFGNTAVSIGSGHSSLLPPYDWNGTFPTNGVVRVTTRYRAPLTVQHQSSSPEIVESISSLVNTCFPELRPSVKTMTEWMEGGRNHHYSVEIPLSETMMFASRVCKHLRLVSGVGTFEVCGSPQDLAEVVEKNGFRSVDFPSTASNLNVHDTPFALQAYSFFVPVCNVSDSDLGKVARLRHSMGEKIVYSLVMRRYLSWKLPDGKMSPKVQGNYLLISQQKSGGYAISLGFERYEDKDPTARQFTSFAAPVLESMGAQLKKVSGPR